MAYVLGFFAADGCITVNKRGGQFWCVQITDKGLLEQIKKVVQSDHKIGVRLHNSGKSSIYRLQIGSIEMCEDLRKLGFSERKTKSLIVPKVPQRYFSDFVRGYFDGDGNVWVGVVHKERVTQTLVIQVAFTSCSELFLKAFRQRLNASGLEGGSIYEAKGNYYRLQFSVRDTLKLYDFMYNHESHSKNTLFLERKRKIFEKYGKLKNMRS